VEQLQQHDDVGRDTVLRAVEILRDEGKWPVSGRPIKSHRPLLSSL
jgi:hypothetical protein